MSLPSPDYENFLSYYPFDTFRDGQEDIANKIKDGLLDPNIQFILVEAGTGWGKSGFALTAAGASKSAYISTANRMLQDQYVQDYSDLMVDLKGRSNYKCLCHKVPKELQPIIGKHYNCVNSPCQDTAASRAACSKDKACEYHRQVDKAAVANITSFNFASALAFLNYMSKRFKPRNLLVCDECHSIPDWITNFVGVPLNIKTLRKLELSESMPDFDDIQDYAGYILKLQNNAKELIEYASGDEYTRLDSFIKKLEMFDGMTENKQKLCNWVMQKTYDYKTKELTKVEFKPVDISQVAHDFFFKHGIKVILLSATILDFKTYMDMLGIPENKALIIKAPSIFPVERHPIVTSMSVGYINAKNIDMLLPNIAEKVKYILDYYPDFKGIIHGVTYKICNYIYDTLNDDRILYPKTSSEQKEIFEIHKTSKKPTILLSPSMTEGLDLKGDLSRLQILAKMPYAFLGAPELKKRMQLYPNYYNMLTALKLTQGLGRSMRYAEDFCFSFPLDANFISFVESNMDILPAELVQSINIG